MQFSSFSLASIALLLSVTVAAPADSSVPAPVEASAPTTSEVVPVEEGDGQMTIMNFSNSCGACYMDGARLICKCRTKSGTHRWTETDLAERLGNSRGTLVWNSGNYIASCWDSKFWSKDGLGGTDEMCARCSEGGAGSGSKYSCVYLGDKIENQDGYMRWS